MMCYRDMTFCTFYGECRKGKKCRRALTKKVKIDAEKWWGSKDAPIASYVNKPGCFAKIKKG